MVVSSFPVLSSLRASVNISSDVSLFSLNLPLLKLCYRSSTVVFYYRLLVQIWDDTVTERNKKLLEQHGLDPDEFLLNLLLIFLKVRKSGKGKQILAEDLKSQRTHKLLQVADNREAKLTETDIMEKYSLVKWKNERDGG